MKYLGKPNTRATRKLDTIPWKGNMSMAVALDCTEFTSHCPVTGQPDFATLLIEYDPHKLLVETKSLKLFLWSFRSVGKFNEEIVDEIAQAFFDQVRPRRVEVRGTFHQRGGIAVQARSTRWAAQGKG
jgi:7-cyano-7-deazaguanine reductase